TLVQPDIYRHAHALGIVMAEGAAVEIDRGGLILGQEGGETTAVVVVPVGDDDQDHRRDLQSEFLGVLKEQGVRTHVKENFAAIGLDVKAQPVLGAQGRVVGGIFHQCSDFHMQFPISCRQAAAQ